MSCKEYSHTMGLRLTIKCVFCGETFVSSKREKKAHKRCELLYLAEEESLTFVSSYQPEFDRLMRAVSNVVQVDREIFCDLPEQHGKNLAQVLTELDNAFFRLIQVSNEYEPGGVL